MTKHGQVPTELHLWALKFEYHIIFMCHKTFFLPLIFFQPIKNVKIILDLYILQSQTMGQIWPTGLDL